MAMTILASRCADCNLCIDLCPTAAILPPRREGKQRSTAIDPERCTECVGHFAWPRCVSFCRVGGIVTDLASVENRTALLTRWQALTGGGTYCQEFAQGMDAVEELGEPVA